MLIEDAIMRLAKNGEFPCKSKPFSTRDASCLDICGFNFDSQNQLDLDQNPNNIYGTGGLV